MYRRIFIFIIAAFLAIAWHYPAQSQSPKALELATKAQSLYNSGQLSQAADTWQEAAIAYKAQGDRLGSSSSLVNQSQALQNLGLYPKACRTLLQAFEIKQPECNAVKIDRLIADLTTARQSRIAPSQVVGLRSLGNVILRRGMLIRAKKLLSIAKLSSRNSAEFPKTLLALGNVEAALGKRERDRLGYDKITEIIDRQDLSLALKPFGSAFSAYKSAAQTKMAAPLTQAQAQLNHLALLIDVDDWWQGQVERRLKSWQRLEQTDLVRAAANFSRLLNDKLTQTQSLLTTIESSLASIPPSHQSIYAHINYAKSLDKLGEQDRAAAILQTALQQSRIIKDKLGESYALGYLGHYYAQDNIARAIALTNRALILAQAQTLERDAREITYLWQSQLGHLLEQQGKNNAAIETYAAAFNTLQSLRADLNANDRLVQFDFLQEIKPVYLNLANLLLQSPNIAQAKSVNSLEVASTKADEANQNLELARQVIESLQVAELDNYFQDPCAETADVAVTIDRLDPRAAVIYPIVLSDRLEVILSISGQPLQKFSTPIEQSQVNQTIDLLYDSLYNQSVDNSAINIFSTTPLNPRELAQNTRALLPLLEQVHSWLIKPLSSQLESHQIETLVFVLNGNLQSVPMAALYDGKKYLLENYQIALAPSLQLLDLAAKPRPEVKVLAAGLSEQIEIRGQIFPALKYVPQELKQIKTIFPQSLQLLNQKFTVGEIKQQLQKGFSIVHLATHGVFSSDPRQTFIVTGDRDTIDIDTLSSLLGSSTDNKPELIVLSACDTATGDERAILGFAGVAVRSGSATLGSLWSVEDASTAQLMSQFYRELENPSRTKAAALQQAQLSLIQSLRANPIPDLKQLPPHPYYWAPYVLVGNWQ